MGVFKGAFFELVVPYGMSYVDEVVPWWFLYGAVVVSWSLWGRVCWWCLG